MQYNFFFGGGQTVEG